MERCRQWVQGTLQPALAARVLYSISRPRSHDLFERLALRRGDCLEILEVLEGADTMRVAGAVVLALRKHPGACAIIDEIGLGAGVLDRLREQGLPAFGVNVARPPSSTTKSANVSLGATASPRASRGRPPGPAKATVSAANVAV